MKCYILKCMNGDYEVFADYEFEYFNHKFIIHNDIINDHLFVCTHVESGFKLPIYADTLDEMKRYSIYFLKGLGLSKFKKGINNISY